MKKTIKKENSKWILLFLFTFFCVGVQGQYDEYGSSGGCDPDSISATEKGGTFDTNGVNQYGIQRTIDHWEKVPDVPQSAASGQAVVMSKAVYTYSCAKKQNTGSMTGIWYSTAGNNNTVVGGGGPAPKPKCTLTAATCAPKILKDCACVEKPCAITACPTGLKLVNCECIKDCDITPAAVIAAFKGTASIVNGVSSAINKYGALLGIDSKLEVQHFLAQAALESGNFSSTKESTKYQTSVVMEIFGEFFNDIGEENKNRNLKNLSDFGTTTTKEGKTYVINREALFNHIYNDQNRISVGWNPIGNTQTGDGYLYIGRGAIQITGRDNYTNFNNWYKANVDSSVDLVKNPQLLDTNKEIGTLASLWYFKNRVMDKLGGITDKTTVDQVTKKVNTNMLEKVKRRENFEKAKKNIDC